MKNERRKSPWEKALHYRNRENMNRPILRRGGEMKKNLDG